MTDDKDLRPPFCLDDNCQCLLNPQSLCVENIKKGFSGTCFGKMKVPVDWKFNKVNHINSYYLCFYTPFKGWMRFAMDFDDLRALKMGVLTLLQVADEHPEEQEAIDEIIREREKTD